jgi:ribosome maturation factor RimP
MKKISDDLWNLLEETVESLDVEMLGAEFDTTQGGLLRVYLDSPNGINISDCSRVSRQLSTVLDVEDIIQGNYTLEVSSPGIDRPLFAKKHFEAVIGETIVVKLQFPDVLTRRKKFVGILDQVSDEMILMTVDNESFDFQLSDIKNANLQAKI